MNLKSLRVCFVSSILLLSVNVGAIASTTSLNYFFNEVETLQANFVQNVSDDRGFLLESSSGVFSLSRPGKFRWDYKLSDVFGLLDEDDDQQIEQLSSQRRGQQIVADGKSIYLYDPDLEQVTQRSLTDALGQVPSLLLVQSKSDISKHFSVESFGLTDGLTWVKLSPLDEDAGYQHLMIGFKENTIRQIELLDGIGNKTLLMLSKVKENINLTNELFTFNVPEGTDVLSDQIDYSE